MEERETVDLPTFHCGNEKTHNPEKCNKCKLDRITQSIYDNLIALTPNERTAVLWWLSGRLCLDCGSNLGRRCKCQD